jgi:hypothetical protein
MEFLCKEEEDVSELFVKKEFQTFSLCNEEELIQTYLSVDLVEYLHSKAEKFGNPLDIRLILTEFSYNSVSLGMIESLKGTIEKLPPFDFNKTFAQFKCALLIGPWYLEFTNTSICVPKRITSAFRTLFHKIPPIINLKEISLSDCAKKISKVVSHWNSNFVYKNHEPQKKKKEGNCYSFITEILSMFHEKEFQFHGCLNSFMNEIRIFDESGSSIFPTDNLEEFEEKFKFTGMHDLKSHSLLDNQYLDMLDIYGNFKEKYFHDYLVFQAIDLGFWFRSMISDKVEYVQCVEEDIHSCPFFKRDLFFEIFENSYETFIKVEPSKMSLKNLSQVDVILTAPEKPTIRKSQFFTKISNIASAIDLQDYTASRMTIDTHKHSSYFVREKWTNLKHLQQEIEKKNEEDEKERKGSHRFTIKLNAKAKAEEIRKSVLLKEKKSNSNEKLVKTDSLVLTPKKIPEIKKELTTQKESPKFVQSLMDIGTFQPTTDKSPKKNETVENIRRASVMVQSRKRTDTTFKVQPPDALKANQPRKRGASVRGSSNENENQGKFIKSIVEESKNTALKKLEVFDNPKERNLFEKYSIEFYAYEEFLFYELYQKFLNEESMFEKNSLAQILFDKFIDERGKNSISFDHRDLKKMKLLFPEDPGKALRFAYLKVFQNLSELYEKFKVSNYEESLKEKNSLIKFPTTFDDLIADEDSFNLFSSFVSECFGSQYIECWNDLKKYMTSPTTDLKNQLLNYCKLSSPKHLLHNPDIRKDIFKEKAVHGWDEVLYSYIYKILANEYYPRFINSKSWKNFCESYFVENENLKFRELYEILSVEKKFQISKIEHYIVKNNITSESFKAKKKVFKEKSELQNQFKTVKKSCSHLK